MSRRVRGLRALPRRVVEAGVAAVVLLVTAWRPAPVEAVDRAVVRALAGTGPVDAVRALTRLGEPTVVLALAVVALVAASRGRPPWRSLAVVVVGVLAAGLLADAVKDLVGRARPAGSTLTNPAFPSAHAARTGALAALTGHPAAVALTVVVGVTRVVLGVHWPSDVVGGWALAVLVAAVLPDVRARRRRRAG